jgi:putative ABC transport system permease protein
MNSHSSAEVERGLELEQFSRIHLYSDVTSWGNIKKIYLFVAIGILILIIASINFMNLSTARSIKRSREVGLRKVVGANKGQLIKQFIGESILTSGVALILAIVLVINILPLFRNITEQDLIFPSLTDWNFFGLLLIIALLVGFISGSYPALYLSSFSPINVLRGNKSPKGKNSNLRKFLVVAQFSIAIGLIISTLSINHQIDFLHNKSLGFQKDQIVVIPVLGDNFREDTEAFKQELLKNTNILAVSGSLLLPSRIRMFNNVTWEGAAENESIALIQNKVDYDFLDLYEIPIVEGRNFSREHSSDILDYRRENEIGAVILNQEAVKRFGWNDPINKKVIQTYGTERWSLNVIGVIADFHFASLHNKIVPLSIFLRPAGPWNFSVKINPENMPNTIDYIRKTWATFNPDFPFDYYFLDETFDKIYKSEEKLQTLFSYFSLLSVIISCLGLFGLAAFAAEQKTKEIGVRKVLGASVSSILMLLSKEFTKWVIIANILAWPAAWFYLNSWLDEFAYSADIAWPIFFAAGGIAILIALLTVSIQTLKAALANPIKSLRYE